VVELQQPRPEQVRVVVDGRARRRRVGRWPEPLEAVQALGDDDLGPRVPAAGQVLDGGARPEDALGARALCGPGRGGRR
jgi:hypothetical protein